MRFQRPLGYNAFMGRIRLMNAEQPKYWFHAKRYGWGWGLPATWQGWVVFAIWMSTVLVVSPLLAARSLAFFYLFLAGMTSAMLAVCYIKGEPPGWRWGESRDK
jgi:hypothetical protein